MMSSPWWRDAVVYQIYVRSFADGNGDGTGDLAGLRSRLPYLASLGVDAIWVNPWYPSPLHDGGYDVADYRAINPLFGTLEEADRLFAEAAGLGIKVLVDLVPNHTSVEHPWFEEALAAGPGSPARDRYLFRPGRPDGGPPSDWRSTFGGPAWTQVEDGEWYLHLFDWSQPDLNWQNPEVRTEFREIIAFWLDRGAAGLRVDVAHALTKDLTFPDLGDDDRVLAGGGPPGGNHPHWDRDDVHPIVREWRAVLDRYEGERMMVAEAWVDGWDRLALYVRPDEYHQAFNFDFLMTPWDAAALHQGISRSLEGAGSVGSVPTWVLSNHDVIRHPTRYGLVSGVTPRRWLAAPDPASLDPALGTRRARAIIHLMLALPGSVYLYQGEELGLHEVWDLPDEVLDDPVWTRSDHTDRGRDGCRVPIPWTRTGDSYGFGENGSWLPQPAGWGELSVEAETGDEESMLELYRRLIALRKRHRHATEQVEWLEGEDQVISLRRSTGLTCVINFGESPVALPEGAVISASVDLDPDGRLPGNAAVWIVS